MKKKHIQPSLLHWISLVFITLDKCQHLASNVNLVHTINEFSTAVWHGHWPASIILFAKSSNNPLVLDSWGKYMRAYREGDSSQQKCKKKLQPYFFYDQPICWNNNNMVGQRCSLKNSKIIQVPMYSFFKLCCVQLVFILLL